MKNKNNPYKAVAEERMKFAQMVWRNYLAELIEPKRTASGLGYIIHEHGEGIRPRPGQLVEVHYIGLLSKDGKKFDESFRGGKSFRFNLGQGQVIAGWDEGIGLLQVGDRATLFIPHTLGYGRQGIPRVIPPSSELVFYVELVSVK
jgi:FKBP-type peptidyl-prolyl cis-trans isomerase